VTASLLRARTYGSAGPPVVVLHGGPGAAGSAAAIARGLAGSFRVLEPFQRGSGGEPLTVARHVADLRALLDATWPGVRPGVVGHSWGAMLALAYASEHPDRAGPLVLVGCGTFDRASREEMNAIREWRLGQEGRLRLERLTAEHPDPDERLAAAAQLLFRVDSCDLATTTVESWTCDARAHDETWRDALRLQDEGVHPRAFAAIRSPVLMLHGDEDPHPGPKIRASLEPFVRRLEYREWKRCGHYPWLERSVGAAFFAVVSEWLASRTAEGGAFLDRFSKVAADYAEHRPRYPRELYATLAALAPGRRLAWDCATGNGQAALGLAEHFERVVATDASPSQIGAASFHPRVRFRVAAAEASGLPDSSVDLVTVAQAAHWLDRRRFFEEVDRVLAPRGVVALWCYGAVEVDRDLDPAVNRFRTVVEPFWPRERALVDDGYRSLEFPYEEIAMPKFVFEATMTLEGFAGYVRTWSSTQACVAARGRDVVEDLVRDLSFAWPNPEVARKVRWPLHLRVGRRRDGRAPRDGSDVS
jgi:pimeloyl-ACP methyl ester carboxylesterase/ubiquinone/menaquinone biosynthesis C-methylase UbiE